MKKQTLPYEVTTAEDGTTRVLMVHQVYGNVLPNALQNAVIEAAQAVSDLAYDLKIDLPAFDDLSKHLLDGWPVMSKDCSSELASKVMLDTLHVLHSLRHTLLTTLRLQKAADASTDVDLDIAA